MQIDSARLAIWLVTDQCLGISNVSSLWGQLEGSFTSSSFSWCSCRQRRIHVPLMYHDMFCSWYLMADAFQTILSQATLCQAVCNIASCPISCVCAQYAFIWSMQYLSLKKLHFIKAGLNFRMWQLNCRSNKAAVVFVLNPSHHSQHASLRFPRRIQLLTSSYVCANCFLLDRAGLHCMFANLSVHALHRTKHITLAMTL